MTKTINTIDPQGQYRQYKIQMNTITIIILISINASFFISQLNNFHFFSGGVPWSGIGSLPWLKYNQNNDQQGRSLASPPTPMM